MCVCGGGGGGGCAVKCADILLNSLQKHDGDTV